MIFSRLFSRKTKDHPRKFPALDKFLVNRDYIGAIALLAYQFKSDQTNVKILLWLGYCYFRLGEYDNARMVYEHMLIVKECPPEVKVYLGCCLFHLGRYSDAKEHAEKESGLQNRLLFHLAYKLKDEEKLIFHQMRLLKNSYQDELSLAAMHYMRQNYKEAYDIYFAVTVEHNIQVTGLAGEPKWILPKKYVYAINVYCAMCSYHMKRYSDMRYLKEYLKAFPDSPAVLNLHCAMLHCMSKHAPVNLPGIVEKVPEARLNLILYYVKERNYEGAYKLAEKLEPEKPIEFVVKALAYAMWGNNVDCREDTDLAERCFKVFGESRLVADKIIGRQAMAAHHFLCGRYAEALSYYESILRYLKEDDSFLFNLGQCLLMCNSSSGAEVAFLSVNPKAHEMTLPVYKYLLAKALIHNGKPEVVWVMIKQTTEPHIAFVLAKILANEGFRVKQYFYSALAFDRLSRTEPNPSYHQGILCSASGLFRQFIEKKKSMSAVISFAKKMDSSLIQQISVLCRVLVRNGQPVADRIASVVARFSLRNRIQLVSEEFDYTLL